MFQHVFQDLKAVEDAVAFFFSNAPSKLGSDECFTYAHNHLYHIVNCLEQVAADSKVGSIGWKSYMRVLIHEEQLLTVSYDASTLFINLYQLRCPL